MPKLIETCVTDCGDRVLIQLIEQRRFRTKHVLSRNVTENRISKHVLNKFSSPAIWYLDMRLGRLSCPWVWLTSKSYKYAKHNCKLSKTAFLFHKTFHPFSSPAILYAYRRRWRLHVLALPFWGGQKRVTYVGHLAKPNFFKDCISFPQKYCNISSSPGF